LICTVDSWVAVRVSAIVDVEALGVVPITAFGLLVAGLGDPANGVIKMRHVALLLLSLLPVGLAFDEVLSDFTPTIIGCVLQLTIGTLQLFLRHLDALGR
jgi:hypothetical protein